MKDEEKMSISQVAKTGRKVRFIYEYDFGDSWQHEILLEKILEPDPNVAYPAASKGRERVHRRMWEAPGVMPSFSKPSVTQTMRITLKWWNGSTASSTRRSSRWTR